MTAVLAIDRRSKPLVRSATTAGTFNDAGDPVAGTPVVTTIRGAIQPISGAMLRDLAEGVRVEARWAVWSRSELAVDDVLTFADESYRVLFVWDRRGDGDFFRAAVGLLKE